MGISFIIPVFNSEKSLSRCLDSIINAKKQNDIEVICINDGSKDNSLNILKKYANRYNFFKYIDKKNEGPFIARKIGVDLAKFEYVGFIDSDDWIEENMIQEVEESIKKTKVDIVLFQYINDYVDEPSVVSKIDLKKKIYAKEEFREKIYPYLMSDGLLNGLCNKVYKKTLFDNSVEFNYVYGEDLVYQLNVFDKANNLFFIGESLYHYTHERSNSLSNTKQDIHLLCDMYEIRRKYQEKWQVEEKLLLSPFINLVCMCLLASLKTMDLSSVKFILNSKQVKYAIKRTREFQTESRNLKILYKILKIRFR